jgi:hypothetical protein
MYIAEQFTFAGGKLIDVRVHVCDAPQKSASTTGPRAQWW